MQKTNDYTILCNGCSFSVRKIASNGDFRWDSYGYYLPGTVYSIAGSGSGIESSRVEKFIGRRINSSLLSEVTEEGKPKIEKFNVENLTHFIYQIPNVLRQPIYDDLDGNDFLEASIEIRVAFRNYKALKGLEDQSSYLRFRSENVLSYPQTNIVKQLHRIDRYFKKGLLELDKVLFLLRNKWRDIKIIFLRYNQTGKGRRRLELASKEFFDKHLFDYCNQNKITYIYDNDFCTGRFTKLGLTYDEGHPNTNGAKLIAKKITEYL